MKDPSRTPVPANSHCSSRSTCAASSRVGATTNPRAPFRPALAAAAPDLVAFARPAAAATTVPDPVAAGEAPASAATAPDSVAAGEAPASAAPVPDSMAAGEATASAATASDSAASGVVSTSGVPAVVVVGSIVSASDARASVGRGRAGARSVSAIKVPKATVLPDPVCDETRRSRPARAGSRTAACTGVAVS